jgi:hypothetical protein
LSTVADWMKPVTSKAVLDGSTGSAAIVFPRPTAGTIAPPSARAPVVANIAKRERRPCLIVIAIPVQVPAVVLAHPD